MMREGADPSAVYVLVLLFFFFFGALSLDSCSVFHPAIPLFMAANLSLPLLPPLSPAGASPPPRRLLLLLLLIFQSDYFSTSTFFLIVFSLSLSFFFLTGRYGTLQGSYWQAPHCIEGVLRGRAATASHVYTEAKLDEEGRRRRRENERASKRALFFFLKEGGGSACIYLYLSMTEEIRAGEQNGEVILVSFFVLFFFYRRLYVYQPIYIYLYF